LAYANLEHAQRSAELSEAVDNLVSNQLSTVAAFFAAFRATEHLGHPARTAARRVPGIVVPMLDARCDPLRLDATGQLVERLLAREPLECALRPAGLPEG